MPKIQEYQGKGLLRKAAGSRGKLLRVFRRLPVRDWPDFPGPVSFMFLDDIAAVDNDFGAGNVF